MRALVFPIEDFLKESKKWKEEKDRLQKEMDNLSFLPSVDNKTGVRSGDISNLTAQIALRRLEIQAEIEDILLNEEMLRYARKRLTKDENRLIDGFYYPKKKIGVFVQEYGQEKGLGKNLVYEERARALEKMRMIIESEYYR